MLISDTRKKSIVSADLRSGMKGKCQKVFLNLLIEKRKKITKVFNFSVLYCCSHFKNLLNEFSVLFLPSSPNLLMIFTVLYHFPDTSDAMHFLRSVLSNTNYFFLSKGQQARYSHLTMPCLIYTHIFFD